MSSWKSYPSVFNLGHRVLAELFSDPVLVEEKIDGSQFSFGLIGGVLRVRSKGAEMNSEAPEKMFDKAVETVSTLAPVLVPGYTYRGEFLRTPKHNTLAYDRTPVGHIIIFDINVDEESYLTYEDKKIEATRLGLEVVPRLYEGRIDSADAIRHLLLLDSCLGGQKVEGVVVKNYARFGPDKKALMGKYVSEAFKEVHGGEWKRNNPTSGDIISELINRYRTPARWNKAIQHFRENGQLQNSPRDIGALLREIPEDMRKECESDIRDALFAFAWPKIRRGITMGFPEHYKQYLLDQQFEAPKDESKEHEGGAS
jgi:hypothetical protein